jgi:hypothetical protein
MSSENTNTLDQFDFSLEETWPQNLSRVKAHLESIDCACAKILFDNIALLLSDDVSARRNFNQKVFDAINAAAEIEIGAGIE